MFVGVTAEKLVGGPICRGGGGGEFIKNFHKTEIYLIRESFVGKKFLGKIFVT